MTNWTVKRDRRPKVLIITRVYSGFTSSLLNGEWPPRGMPAIYKLLEHLPEEGFNLDIFMTCRDYPLDWPHQADIVVYFEAPNITVRVLHWGLDRRKKKMRWVLTGWRLARQWIVLVIHYIRTSPDIVYVDHANNIFGALVARLTRTPVVFRVTGIHEAMRKSLIRSGLQARFERFCYAAPFELIVATLDGSGSRNWLSNSARHAKKRCVMLNGVDRGDVANSADAKSPKHDNLDSPLYVVFVGRLEPEKGGEQFIRAFYRASSKTKISAQARIIGTGSQEKYLRGLVHELGLDGGVEFLGGLSHAQVYSLLQNSQIYVSANQLGNLSSANLEALCADCCVVIPSSQIDRGIDLETDEELSDEMVIRYGHFSDVDGLASALEELLANPSRREAMVNHCRLWVSENVLSWRERISKESVLLHELLKKDGNA